MRLVSAADKLYNARSILQDYHTQGDEVWQRFKGGKDGSLWYYRSLVETFQNLESPPNLQALIAELARVVEQLENYVFSQ